MRVLMVSKALVVSSYRTKLRELSRSGAQMFAVVPTSWREGGRPIRYEAGSDHGTSEVIQADLAWNGHYHLYYFPTLRRIVRQVRPDIVHVDEEAYNLATYLAFGCADSVKARSLFFTWQNINRGYPPPFRQFERSVYGRAAYAIAGSGEALAILKAKGYSGPAQVIPQFGVDLNQFTPSERSSHPFTVGFLGRLVPEKGIGDLMAAFSRLAPPSRLIVAGEGTLAGYLEMAGADLKRQGRLERYPRIPSGDVPALLRRLDVVVLPSRTTSRWREQYGRILVEAMASNVAVIGSDSGEIPAVIGDAGLVFREGNVEDLTRNLNLLANSPGLQEDLARRGRERAAALFSQRSVADRTFAVYQEMLSGSKTE